MPDRSAIFSSILTRNALRREAHLPLLDVRQTFDREVEQALWRAHVGQHVETVRAQVWARRRAHHGPTWGLSAGGRWAVNAEVRAILRESFQAEMRDEGRV